MLAYAPRPDQKKLRRATLGLIVLGHAGLLALVMTARSGFITPTKQNPPDILFYPLPKTPTPPEPQPNPSQPQQPIASDTSSRSSHYPKPGPIVERLPEAVPNPGPTIGPGTELSPPYDPVEPPLVRTRPRFATSGDAVRPPYPIAKREAGDEASLRLKLTIDERGRVIAVDAVGRADPTFLDAARRHILRVWRYHPAMEGTKAVPSTATITLKFELGNA